MKQATGLTVSTSLAEGEATSSGVESFEGLYRREGQRMVRLAFLLVGSQQLAEEIVQDAFAQIFERWERVQQPTAYLRTSVVNGCRTAHRRRGRERRISAQQRGPSPTPLGADHLRDALEALPRRQRAAIVLRYYGDLSEADIALALSVRPGTVKSLVHRGLAQLREVIDP